MNNPLREDSHWRQDAAHITNTIDTEWANEIGVHGVCEFMRLRSIDFPRSFGIDPMHLFYENLVPNMFNHMRGKFFPQNQTIIEPPESNENETEDSITLQRPTPSTNQNLQRPTPSTNQTKTKKPAKKHYDSSNENSSSSESQSSTTSDSESEPDLRRRASAPTKIAKRQLRDPGIVTSLPSTQSHSLTTKSKKKKPSTNKYGRQPKFVQTNDPYCLSPKVWDQIGKDMESSKSTYPAQFGDPLSSITARCHQYKAHEWSQWAHTLSLIYLKGTLPDLYYAQYCRLIEAISQCAAAEITDEHIAEIRGSFPFEVIYWYPRLII